MLHKSCLAAVKAAGDADGLKDGQFRAVVSVFGNKDSYGDIVMPGAFADSLAEWGARGDSIPIYWSHRMDDPDFNIGWVLEAKETDTGLEILGQIDLEAEGTKARQVWRLLKGRRVTQFSFAYDVDEAAWVESDDDYWYELRKLRVHEVGPTPIGANQETELLAVKAAAEHATRFVNQLKAGRVLSVSNEKSLRDAATSLAEARSQITNVLTAVQGSEASNDEKAKASESAKDEHRQVKSEEPVRPSPPEMSALLSIQLADAG